MEAEAVGKAILVVMVAVGVAYFVMRVIPRGEMNAGGCGPRALLMVATRFGATLDEEATLALFPRNGFEVSISEMEAMAPKLGVKAKSREMSSAELKAQKPLGVLHVDGTHFVAVVGHEQDALLVVDPLYKGETKPVRWLYDDLKTRWSGAILVVTRK